MKNNQKQNDFLDKRQTAQVEDLAKEVFELLAAKQKKLAVAESCTGGQLSNVLTGVPGISEVYTGGICSYMNTAKINVLGVAKELIDDCSAVSEPVALAMATRIAELFRVDYTVSTTGYAGPEGGDAGNPLGTVYIGLCSSGSGYVRKFNFSGSREDIKAQAVKAALLLLIETLQRE